MSVSRLFEKLQEALEAIGIPYFVTGCFVSSAHGIPRSTNDIDIIIAPTGEQLNARTPTAMTRRAFAGDGSRRSRASTSMPPRQRTS